MRFVSSAGAAVPRGRNTLEKTGYTKLLPGFLLSTGPFSLS